MSTTPESRTETIRKAAATIDWMSSRMLFPDRTAEELKTQFAAEKQLVDDLYDIAETMEKQPQEAA